jgi:6-phosphofructokinase 1
VLGLMFVTGCTGHKPHALVVVAQEAKYNAGALAAHFPDHQEEVSFDLRVTTLGHVQRGSAPGAFDQILTTELAQARPMPSIGASTACSVTSSRERRLPTPCAKSSGRRNPCSFTSWNSHGCSQSSM